MGRPIREASSTPSAVPRPALAAVLLALSVLVACEGGADAHYAFEPGHFEPDSVPGIERVDAAAAQGDPDAQYKVALFRHFMAGDHETAVAEFRRLAADDHPASVGMMAHAYMYGKGAPVDHAEAARWLERAAALGDERAARDLAAYRARRP